MIDSTRFTLSNHRLQRLKRADYLLILEEDIISIERNHKSLGEIDWIEDTMIKAYRVTLEGVINKKHKLNQ